VIRLSIFLAGFALFLVGAASHFENINLPFDLPFDLQKIVCSIGFTTFGLDVVAMVAGIFLILIALVFHRLWPLE
jgi:hypothetical protein